MSEKELGSEENWDNYECSRDNGNVDPRRTIEM